MNTQTDNQVIARFNEAINTLIERKAIESLQSYCTKYGLDASAMASNFANGNLTNFHFDWLTPLILDYGTSSLWLLTGLGEAFHPLYNPTKTTS